MIRMSAATAPCTDLLLPMLRQTFGVFEGLEGFSVFTSNTSSNGSCPDQAGPRQMMNAGGWSPSVDIVEDEGEYVFDMELPQVRLEDIDVTVQNLLLTIRGERRVVRGGSDIRCHKLERATGTFVRTFVLPGDADEAKVTAVLQDGLLSIRLAKKNDAKQKPIEVKAA